MQLLSPRVVWHPEVKMIKIRDEIISRIDHLNEFSSLQTLYEQGKNDQGTHLIFEHILNCFLLFQTSVSNDGKAEGFF